MHRDLAMCNLQRVEEQSLGFLGLRLQAVGRNLNLKPQNPKPRPLQPQSSCDLGDQQEVEQVTDFFFFLSGLLQQ